METLQKHPYQPFVSKNTTKLIIGSIPPPRFCKPSIGVLYKDDIDWYYGSNRNNFWELFNIGALPLMHGIKARQDLLIKMKVGITDIIQSCIRKKLNIASDKNLKDCTHKNIKDLLNKYSAINTLLYTSEFVKKQMEIALRAKHMLTNEKRKFKIMINGKEYMAYQLYSPSPMGLIHLGKGGKEKRKQQYKEIFG